MASRFLCNRYLTFTPQLFISAIEPIPTKTISNSQSTFNINDNNTSNDTNQLFSLFPSFDSTERIIVHNQASITLTQIYSDKAISYVNQWYENNSVPNLNTLIKCNLLKIYKEKSIGMMINNVRCNRIV